MQEKGYEALYWPWRIGKHQPFTLSGLIDFTGCALRFLQILFSSHRTPCSNGVESAKCHSRPPAVVFKLVVCPSNLPDFSAISLVFLKNNPSLNHPQRLQCSHVNVCESLGRDKQWSKNSIPLEGIKNDLDIWLIIMIIHKSSLMHLVDTYWCLLHIIVIIVHLPSFVCTLPTGWRQ